MSKNQKIGGARYIGLCLAVIVTLGLILTLQSGTARANIFPNDTLSAFLETPASNGTVCPNILEAADHERTILYGTIRTTGANEGKITADNFIYLANQNNTSAESFAPYILPANIAVACERANNKPFSFRIAYVNYNLALVPSYQVVIASVSIPTEPLLSQAASASPLTTYGIMTAGDILISLLLFGLIMLNLLTIFLRKV